MQQHSRLVPQNLKLVHEFLAALKSNPKLPAEVFLAGKNLHSGYPGELLRDLQRAKQSVQGAFA